MYVYLEGTGEGDAPMAFALFRRAAAARRLRVVVEDPVELEYGFGRFFVDVGHADTREDDTPTRAHIRTRHPARRRSAPTRRCRSRCLCQTRPQVIEGRR